MDASHMSFRDIYENFKNPSNTIISTQMHHDS